MLCYIRQQRLSLIKSKLSLVHSCFTKRDNGHADDECHTSNSVELPEAPTTCCMSACPNCVWIEYANRLNELLSDGGEKSLKIIEEKVIDLFSTLASNNYDYKTNLVYIEENECSDASFLVTNFIWEALNVHNAEVITILFHNSIQHYQHLISKVTQNIANLYNKPKTIDVNITDFFNNNSLNVTTLLSNIRDFCDQRAETNLLVVIDDISYICLMSSLHNCIYFIRYCLRLLSTYPKLRIVIGSHNSSNDEELNIISSFLQHCSKFNLIVTPLNSGFSSEVSGHLTIASRTRFENNINKYYYKLDDKKILINPYIL